MPEPVARRYREGGENYRAPSTATMSSVIYAQLLSFDDFSRTMKTDHSVTMLNFGWSGRSTAPPNGTVETGAQHAGQRPAGHIMTWWCRGSTTPAETIVFAKELVDILELDSNDQHDARVHASASTADR